jgi:START domain
MFRDGHVIHRIPKDWTRYGGKDEVAENVNLPLYSVKWAAYALPFPLWWRDFIFCELTCWTPEGYGVSLAMSMPRITEKIPSLEESHKLVRGSIGMSGYLWRNVPGSDPNKPTGEGHMMTEITYLLQVEPKGVLPPWAVNLTGAQQGMNCLRVVRYAEEQRRLVLKMYDENPELNRTEVMVQSIPKGEAFEIPVEVSVAGKTIIVDWVLEENDISFSIVGPDGEKLVNVEKASHNMAH